MRSRRRRYIFLSTLVGLALAGLIVVQVVYLERAYDRELRIFSQNINGALGDIVRKIEAREAWLMVSSLEIENGGVSGKGTMTFSIEANDPLKKRKKILATSHPDSILKKENFVSIIRIDSTGCDTTIWSNQQHDSMMAVKSGSPDSILDRRYIIQKVLEDMEGMNDEPVTDRIDPAMLDSVVALTLADAGIETRFAYGISQSNGDSLVMAVPGDYSEDLLRTGFRTRLFPHDLVARDDELLLYFPDQSSYLLGREGAFLALALCSILLLTGCFIYVIRTLWRQKHFSRQLVDFINNMTHEFKTPISTIAIVGENLAAKTGSIEPDRLENYARILTQESGRMKRQVEKILEMAALEEGDLSLAPSPVDLHAMLMSAAEGISMRIEPAGGKIETTFTTEMAMIEADPTHLGNVFHNLLDNAAKYTAGQPHILISTKDKNGFVTVSIKDNGIGMRNEDIRHVFDRYYRVSTGDLHDVKGFGLGLSYVKLIVEAHGGSILVSSSPGRGSTFRISLPKRFHSGDSGDSA